MECQSQKTKLAENMKRIGFLRVLNEENAPASHSRFQRLPIW